MIGLMLVVMLAVKLVGRYRAAVVLFGRNLQINFNDTRYGAIMMSWESRNFKNHSPSEVIIMGRFTLRLPETLHTELESLAQQEGVSLNQYIVYALTRQIAPAYTIQVMSDENIRQQRESFDKLLETLREGSMTEVRTFLAEREPGELEEGLTEEMVARLKKKFNKVGGKNGK